MSVDIEASSSHGDFPVPIKSYKKLATNIVDYFEENNDISKDKYKNILKEIIKNAFGYDGNTMSSIDLVYPKKNIKDEIEIRTDKWLKTKVRDRVVNSEEHLIEAAFENAYKVLNKAVETERHENDGDSDSDDETNEVIEPKEYKISSGFNGADTYKDKESTIVDVINDKGFGREGKINELSLSLRNNFPQLEGDKVTFIGSTFFKYGDTAPYLNHCIALNSCDSIERNVANSQIDTYETEKEVLTAWTELVQRINPDIVIGYNIFGFDYEFMFRRAQELRCVDEFLKLSRNKDEVCATKDYKTGKLEIDKSSITLASGTHELSIIKMNGRLQVDMLNWFRRNENLTSYKLDYVAGYFIGDVVKSLVHNNNITRVQTNNMTGLIVDSYIHFEEINYSSDYYKNGLKFKVININKDDKWFEIEGIEAPQGNKVKWGLAKDDVTPKDIFRMTNEGSKSRAIVAKYCIQDCNLVHYLFNKVDVITSIVEMSKLCSIPMSFLILRGQGIKLTSYVAKKCREKGVLMPVINKGSMDDGYEGAIVLEPKCGLYLDEAVSVVDYASLYPSSMLSENLCPKSKVWVKIYDLAGNLIQEQGIKDENGGFKYDNLTGREYVDIRFDTYRYVRKTPKSKAEKVLSGYKVCRYVQPKDDEKSIMPSILQELLKARKDTRKLIPQTQDDFIKNVLNQRQLAYKVTANSLYGQLGAKTSTFYEPDIAASTTATGRMLLTYAKRVIEECYDNVDLDTQHGLMNTKAEYVYGDSVANYTPTYIRNNGTINIVTIEGLSEKYGNNNWVTCREEGKQEKEYCELENIETWTDKGWTKLQRIIRHKLAPHKKMIRILTHTGMVDVTDDHSLLQIDGTEISPNNVEIGTRLMHHKLDQQYITKGQHILNKSYEYTNQLDAAKAFNYMQSNNQNVNLSYTKLNTFIVSNDGANDGANDSNAIKKMVQIPDYNDYVYDLTTENHHFAAGIGNMIVHNTDSVFFKFNLVDKTTGEIIRGHKALELSIEIAQSVGHTVTKFLKQPHDLEYEKTYMPFCLLSKKRYVGILYEKDANKGKRNEMGIVLKRRDNAPIVKDIYGGVIDILMKEVNIQLALDFINNSLKELVDGNVKMEKLIITKSIRSFYKNPKSIAHKVLADRIGVREPGNKPTSGDRIPFVYFVNKLETKSKKLLQGEKIETPTFIKSNMPHQFHITRK